MTDALLAAIIGGVITLTGTAITTAASIYVAVRDADTKIKTAEINAGKTPSLLSSNGTPLTTDREWDRKKYGGMLF